MEYSFWSSYLKEAYNEQSNKLKKDRGSYEFIKNKLGEWLFDKTVVPEYKLESIISCGYESYAYCLIIFVNNNKYRIQIPVPKNITIENLEYCHYGKLFFAVEDGCVTRVLYTEYSFSKLKEKITNHFKTI